MASNETKKPGYRASVACSYPTTPDSGDPVRLGQATGVAMTDEDTAGNTVVDFGPGEYDLSVEDSETGGIAIGDSIYFHDAEQMLNNTAASGYFFGIAREAVGDGLTATVKVFHSPVIGATTPVDASCTVPKLSAVANSRIITVPLGAVNATTSFIAFIAPTAGSLNKCMLATKDAIAADDTNYWTIALTDKGADGSASNAIASKTTKVTGGTAFVAYDMWDIGALSATHKVLAAGDVVLLTLTKAASATALAEALAVLEWLPAEAA